MTVATFTVRFTERLTNTHGGTWELVLKNGTERIHRERDINFCLHLIHTYDIKNAPNFNFHNNFLLLIVLNINIVPISCDLGTNLTLHFTFQPRLVVVQ